MRKGFINIIGVMATLASSMAYSAEADAEVFLQVFEAFV